MEESSGGKKLGLMNIIGLGLGGAIGTGIFVLLGSGMAYAGRSISLVVIIGCFFMLLAYWYNLVMPSMFVFKGGDYSMRNLMFNPLMSGANATLAVLGSLSFSSYAIATASYLVIVLPGLEEYQTTIAVIALTLCFLTSVRSSRAITVIENIITVVLIVALACFIIFGISHVDFANYLSSTHDGGFFHGGFKGFISAIAIMGWACQGTTMAPVAMAAVTKNPKRTLPYGILIITVLLSVVYGLMAIVASGILPYDVVAGQNISVVAESFFSKPMYVFFVVGGGICAILSSLLSGIAMQRYPLSQVAEDGWLPAVFKRKTASGYPYVSYIVIYLISFFPIVTGMSIDAIISLRMIPSMIINAYVNMACVTLPAKYPEQWEKRSIKIPKWLFYISSVAGTGCALVVAYNLFIDLTGWDMVICVVLVSFMFIYSFIRLKQGAVKKEDLEETKAKILLEAVEMENE